MVYDPLILFQLGLLLYPFGSSPLPCTCLWKIPAVFITVSPDFICTNLSAGNSIEIIPPFTNWAGLTQSLTYISKHPTTIPLIKCLIGLTAIIVPIIDCTPLLRLGNPKYLLEPFAPFIAVGT